MNYLLIYCLKFSLIGRESLKFLGNTKTRYTNFNFQLPLKQRLSTVFHLISITIDFFFFFFEKDITIELILQNPYLSFVTSKMSHASI